MYKKITENKTSSLQAINSILSMDDTILNNLEIGKGANEVSSISPGVHEKTLNSFEHEWSVCDRVDINDVSERLPNCDINDFEARIDEKSFLNSSFKVSKETNHWQDETFFSVSFTQLISSNEKNDTSDYVNQVRTPKYENRIEETVSNVSTHSISASSNKRKGINILKRHSNDNDNNIPNKRHSLENEKINKRYSNTVNASLKEDCTFYGLPDGIKDLVLKIKGIDKVYEWQDECLRSDAIKTRKNLIYALPTSGGKTLVAEILMLKEIICNKRDAIFVLPFVALVQEKVGTMAPFALELNFLIEEYAAAKGHYPPKKRRKKNSIYICTIEKALGLINSLIEENRLNEIGLMVVDELHILGENGRGATLEVLLTMALYVNEHIQIIGMSATIGNLKEIGEFLKADLYTGKFRPIEIKEYVKCDDDIWLVDLKSEDLLTDPKKINYRYSQNAAIMDPDRIGGLVMDVIPQDSCLIFCSSRKNCENVAVLLTKVLFRSLEEHKKDEKQNLLTALQTEEGLCPILRRTIKFGIAYHHSGLTAEERRLLEDAFRTGILCVICCTSTLAAGVNLPARRVILRSPYVGNKFLNLSRYKQMIGRAGRAGMGNIGESILICKNHELPKVIILCLLLQCIGLPRSHRHDFIDISISLYEIVSVKCLSVKELLMSKMDDSLSKLHIDRDRGINNLILSAILFSIAKTRSELHKLTGNTLLNIQQERLNVNIKQIADQAITEFLKSGVIKVKQNQSSCGGIRPNVSVIIPSQNEDCADKITEIKSKKKTVLMLLGETELELCDLGRASMKGNIDMEVAYTLYADLQKAQDHLIILDYLHLLYLVTPYDIVSQIKPHGSIYYDVVTNLSETQMKTARLCGVNETSIIKIRDGIMPKTVEPRIIQRFYVTLILYDLWTQHAVYSVADKYQVDRGIIQNLLTAVSSFASSVVRFCQELEQFWAFRDLLGTFSKRLSYCCPLELEVLMELPLVKIGRARQLYNAGYKTLQCIAKVKPIDLQERIPYLSKKASIQIVEAAKLLILKKIADLQEETEDILDGIDMLTLNINF